MARDRTTTPGAGLGIRSRLSLWLVLVTLPILLAGTATVRVVETRVADRIEADLTNLRRLETARVTDVLSAYRREAESVAADPDVRRSLDVVERHRRGVAIDALETRRGTRDLPRIDVATTRPLAALADALVRSAATLDSGIVEIGVLDRHGAVLGLSDDHAWQPRDATLVERAMAGSTTLFGEAFRTVAGEDRLGLVTPVRDLDGDTIGALLLETRLDPIVGPLFEHERFGETFVPVAEVRRYVLLAGTVSAVTVLLGWVLFVHPFARRLHGVAAAAERIAEGDMDQRLADAAGDEIGDISRSIDKLAHDLVTDRRERSLAEERLVFQATRDELTGLVNRRHGSALIDELDRNAGAAPVSILFLDLDGFKAVNDSAGHAAGDEILVSVARRLESVLDERALPIRWGGDEFVVVLTGADAEIAERVRRRVVSVFAEPVPTRFGTYPIGCSIGVGTSDGGRQLEELLHTADALMYEQKSRRGETRGAPPPAAGTLARAIDDDRLEAWFQPIVRLLPDGRTRLVGAEALARVRNLDDSIAVPAAFLDEMSGPVARRLDVAMLHMASAALARWIRADRVPSDFVLSLNMSDESMRDGAFADELLARTAALGLPAARLRIEVTETVGDMSRDALGRLREAGVSVALDDIGVARSNLDRLIDLEPDMVKIDRRWIDGVESEGRRRADAILPTLLGLCRALDVGIVVEGVETDAQLAALRSSAPLQLQGYRFSPALVEDAFIGEWGTSNGHRRPSRAA